MKRPIITVCAVLGVSLAMTSSAFAYLGGSYNWAPGEPGYNAGATLHSGTISTSLLTVGDYLGQSSGQPNAAGWGRSDSAVGWDDNWTGGGLGPNANGDFLDGMWVQVYSNGGWWDMGAPVSTIAVFTSQDHGGYLGEGLEYRVWASNTLWDASPVGPAGLTDVYLDGWRTHNTAEDFNGNGWCSDDISGVFNLGGSYRYIQLTAWDTSGGYSEPEVDAVASVVPVPGAVLLGAIGLSTAGWRLRRRTA